MTCGGKVVAKDGRKRKGDEHKRRRTCDQEASDPTDVLATNHAYELRYQESRGSQRDEQLSRDAP
jgi:hypothetical protein